MYCPTADENNKNGVRYNWHLNMPGFIVRLHPGVLHDTIVTAHRNSLAEGNLDHNMAATGSYAGVSITVDTTTPM